MNKQLLRVARLRQNKEVVPVVKKVTFPKYSHHIQSFYNRSLTPQQNKPIRRFSCNCSECGICSSFMLKEHNNHPDSYIKAHHIRKKKRRARHSDYPRLKSAMIQRTSIEVSWSPNVRRKERKAKTFLGPRLIMEQRSRKFQSKDDINVSYRFFYENEIKIAEQLALQTMMNESFESESETPVQQDQELHIIKLIIPSRPIIIKKKQSSHSRKTTESIIQVNQASTNRTLVKYLSEKSISQSYQNIFWNTAHTGGSETNISRKSKFLQISKIYSDRKSNSKKN